MDVWVGPWTMIVFLPSSCLPCSIVGIRVEHRVQIGFGHSWHGVMHRRCLVDILYKVWCNMLTYLQLWAMQLKSKHLWIERAGRQCWQACHLSPHLEKSLWPKYVIKLIWMCQLTPQYDMNMSGNIKLTKLLGPSLSPRCALINETCEKENNDTAGKTEKY